MTELAREYGEGLFDLAREINKARDNGSDVTDAVKAKLGIK